MQNHHDDFYKVKEKFEREISPQEAALRAKGNKPSIYANTLVARRADRRQLRRDKGWAKTGPIPENYWRAN